MSSYDVVSEFGTLYDSAPVYMERPDVAFYVEEANRIGDGSVVLELGSGTGRLTLPLARAGHPVIGLDLSPTMLTRARAKLAAEPEEVRRRVGCGGSPRPSSSTSSRGVDSGSRRCTVGSIAGR